MVSVVLYPSFFIMNACTGYAAKTSIVADGYRIKRRVKWGALVRCHKWLWQHMSGNAHCFSCAVRSSMDATSIWYIPFFSPLLWSSTHESIPWRLHFFSLGPNLSLGFPLLPGRSWCNNISFYSRHSGAWHCRIDLRSNWATQWYQGLKTPTSPHQY